MPTYEFTGDTPVVFAGVVDADGHLWVPSKGDTITVDEPIDNAWLAEVVSSKKPQQPSDVKTPDEPKEH